MSIAGKVAENRIAQADFPFYTGPVGVVQRNGWLDVAFHAADIRVRVPVSGMLDGVPVLITSLNIRPLDPNVKSVRGAMSAITLTVEEQQS